MEKTIKIHLKNKEIYKNKFNEEILSYDLRNYILEETKEISNKQKIKFEIYTNFELEDTEKNKLVDMIRNNFGADISEIIDITWKNRIINFIILSIGIIFILIYSALKNTLISEFSLIIGWIFLGEAICNILYKEVESKNKIAKRKQIVRAKILFNQKENYKNNLKI